MNPILAVLPVTLALIGLAMLLVTAFAPTAPRDPGAPRKEPLSARVSAFLRRGDGKRRLRLIIGIAAGLVVWAISGWVVAIIAVPAGFVFLPELVAKPTTRGIDLTEALAAWTRNLAGLIQTGSLGLEDVIQLSLPSTSQIIRVQVGALVSRLRGGWDTEEALRAFADEFEDPAVDKVAAHLIQASKKRAGDLAQPLGALSDEMAAAVKVRRAVEADRAKPRQSLRIVTLITVGVIILLPFFGRTGQFAPYSTPIGQVALAFWISCYVLLLVWIQGIARESPSPRILVPKDEEARQRELAGRGTR